MSTRYSRALEEVSKQLDANEKHLHVWANAPHEISEESLKLIQQMLKRQLDATGKGDPTDGYEV